MTQREKNKNSTDISPRNAALIGGILLLAISILAPIGHYGVGLQSDGNKLA